MVLDNACLILFGFTGVLFTQDPLTQNPGIVSINANFGLGEVRYSLRGSDLSVFARQNRSICFLQSVVSGSCEPDTLQVARTWDDRLSIQNIVLGKKSRHVTLKGRLTFADVGWLVRNIVNIFWNLQLGSGGV